LIWVRPFPTPQAPRAWPDTLGAVSRLRLVLSGALLAERRDKARLCIAGGSRGPPKSECRIGSGFGSSRSSLLLRMRSGG
jgi:hypothetical protein